MGLIIEKIKVKWHPKVKEYYVGLGYEFTKMGDEFEVWSNEIPDNSNKYRIRYICDNDDCGEICSTSKQNYTMSLQKVGKSYCKKCVNKIYTANKTIKNKIENGDKTFYDWCIENEKECWLHRWDYELNNYSPKEILYGSNRKYYFKCDKHKEHKSEQIKIIGITKGNNIKCKQCNSIAQWFIDNNLDMNSYWDYEKNTEDPWKISCGSNKKVWMFCQENEYHGSYEVSCYDFTSKENRCPYCCHQKIHKLDSLGQYIVDNYGEEFLNVIWSKDNDKSPFEIAPTTSKKYWWNCPDGKHKSYYRSCVASYISEFRCPKCVEELKNSVIEEKTKTYLKELGYEVKTEYECSIIAKNPKTKRCMPYDNEILLSNGKHLIIEVHGRQHYTTKSRYFSEDVKIAKKQLHQRQLYDRYKKYIVWKNGYEYLEIGYMDFAEDRYKQIINNKIKEILNKEV